jgi:hypothetical protein
MPKTPVTCCPTSGDIRVEPWMSWIRTSAAEAAEEPASRPAASAAATTAERAAVLGTTEEGIRELRVRMRGGSKCSTRVNLLVERGSCQGEPGVWRSTGA